jgi:hypothetical protein
MNQDIAIPHPPIISEQDIKNCRETGDHCPILFKWYKFVGELCNFFARIQLASPALRSINSLHYAVLVGLLNRCSRLMLSNIALSHNGLYGETTAILDRCIFESSIKITWLCDKKSDKRFEQFIADGLKTEIKFKTKINENISRHNMQIRVIEERMLKSIEKYIATSELTEDQIISTPKIPPLSQMFPDKENDILYIIGQKLGSHDVHGTWPSRLCKY